MHPNRQFPAHLWFICLRVCMSYFVSHVFCIVIGGGGGDEGTVIAAFVGAQLVVTGWVSDWASPYTNCTRGANVWSRDTIRAPVCSFFARRTGLLNPSPI